MRRDPRLAAVIRRVGPCSMEHRGDPYRMLLRSVIYQQLAGAAARTIDGRLRAPWRGRYPRPELLLAAPDAQLRAAGLSRQKIEAVRSVAEAFAARDVTNRALRAMDDDAVVAAVTQIHGIGEWTAHMLLMFSLGPARRAARGRLRHPQGRDAALRPARAAQAARARGARGAVAPVSQRRVVVPLWRVRRHGSRSRAVRAWMVGRGDSGR